MCAVPRTSSERIQHPGGGGGGPPCPLRWTNIRKPPPQRTAQKPGTANPPMCVPPRTPTARGQHPGGGGADLRVRSTGQTSENTRPNGSPNNLDRPTPMCVPPRTPPARAQHPGGGGADLCVRSAGQTSENPVPMGREKTWIGTPNVRATANTLQKGPAPGSRGGGPLCPLRWISSRKPASQWAAKEPGSEPHPQSIAKHRGRSQVRPPPKPFQDPWKNVPGEHAWAGWCFPEDGGR